MNAGWISDWLSRPCVEPDAGPERVEEVERVRRDVCGYKERSLSAFEGVFVGEEKVGPVSRSWVIVAQCEVEEEECAPLLQLFLAAKPVKKEPKKQKVDVGQALSSDGRRGRNAGPRVGSYARVEVARRVPALFPQTVMTAEQDFRSRKVVDIVGAQQLD